LLISISKKKLSLEKDKRAFFEEQEICWFKGYYFFENKLYKGKNAANHIISNFKKNTLNKFLPQFNGIFSAVIINKNKLSLKIINDRIAPIKLFYYFNQNSIFISDDIYRIKQKINSPNLNIESIIEFLHFRFVSGKYTLFDNIYCTTPSQIIDVSLYRENIKIIENRYWDYSFNINDYNIKEAEKKCFEILNSTIEKFNNQMFKNNKVALNLSGGFDSRAILGLLLQNKINKLNLFTFGHPDCEDIIYTNKIQKQFDLDANVVSSLKIYDQLFNEKLIHSLTSKIGHQCYYFQGYITGLFNNKYTNYDYLITGDVGFTTGLLIDKKIEAIKNDDQLFHNISKRNKHLSTVQISKLLNVSLSPGEIYKIIIGRAKEAIGEIEDYQLQYFKWYQENRLRKYALSTFDLYSKYTNVVYPYFDHNFHDFMFSVPSSIRTNQRVFLNTMSKYIFKNELKPLSRIPYQGRGEYILNNENNYVPKKLNFKKKLQNQFSFLSKNHRLKNLHPLSYLWKNKKKEYLKNINNIINFNSEILKPGATKKIIEQNKNKHMFIQYGLLIILSLLTFEKINQDCQKSINK
tara:strand:+ start:519 stop:2249 length:1731 start_codon:yes stop_codon:yes gene_type:complete